jgi:hypothetical protein
VTSSPSPAVVLGLDEAAVERLLGGRTVSPQELEALAAIHYDWRRHLRDPRSYWVTPSVAAGILGLPVPAIEGLLEENRLPHIKHFSGVRLMRRHEVEAVARARQHRRLPAPTHHLSPLTRGA